MEDFYSLLSVLSIVLAGLTVGMLLVWAYVRYQAKGQENVGDDAYAEFTESATLPDPPLLDDPVTKPTPPALQPDLIIVLYVVAQRDAKLVGTDIFNILEELELSYGSMQIFHHHGVGELKVKQSVFSVANMVEPGTFDPHHLNEFTSPGLVLFMQLPGPFGGRVAFELMLNSAQRIAEVLKGTLLDEQRRVVNPEIISKLRERIAQFEQRI